MGGGLIRWSKDTPRPRRDGGTRRGCLVRATASRRHEARCCEHDDPSAWDRRRGGEPRANPDGEPGTEGFPNRLRADPSISDAAMFTDANVPEADPATFALKRRGRGSAPYLAADRLSNDVIAPLRLSCSAAAAVMAVLALSWSTLRCARSSPRPIWSYYGFGHVAFLDRSRHQRCNQPSEEAAIVVATCI